MHIFIDITDTVKVRHRCSVRAIQTTNRVNRRAAALQRLCGADRVVCHIFTKLVIRGWRTVRKHNDNFGAIARDLAQNVLRMLHAIVSSRCASGVQGIYGIFQLLLSRFGIRQVHYDLGVVIPISVGAVSNGAALAAGKFDDGNIVLDRIRLFVCDLIDEVSNRRFQRGQARGTRLLHIKLRPT